MRVYQAGSGVDDVWMQEQGFYAPKECQLPVV